MVPGLFRSTILSLVWLIFLCSSRSNGLLMGKVAYVRQRFHGIRLRADITVNVEGKQTIVPVKENETLLLAIEDAKLAQKSFCRTGTCGSCAIRITNGAIDCIEHEGDDLIERSKVKKGFVLSCVAFVKKSGAIIELNQEDAYENA